MKEKVRIGVIGCGYWGPNLIRNFAEMPSAELVAVADLRDERVQYIRSRYPHVRVTHDYRDLFDMHLDGVVVTTPPSQHYAVASECLRRGLAVLVEKPMTLNSRDAEDLVRLADEHRCALMVGHTFEYNSAVRALKDIMTRGDLGQIYYISTLRLNLGQVRPDYDVVWDLAPHDISILCYLLDSEPLAVGGSGASLLFGGVYDIAFLCLEFPQRVYAHVRLSWLDPCKVRQVTVVGSDKMAVYDDMSSNEKIKIYDQHVSGHTYTDTFGEFQLQYHHGDIVIPHIPFSEPLRAECEHFVHCIQTGAVPQSDGLSGLRVVKVIETAEHSMDNGGGLESLSLNRGASPYVDA